MNSVTTAHCSSSTYQRRWAEAPTLSEIVQESFTALEAALAEGEYVDPTSLRTLYRDFYLRALSERGVGGLALQMSRLDREVQEFIQALEGHLLKNNVYADIYPIRKEMNWFKNADYHAYWMTNQNDSNRAVDFIRSCHKDHRIGFLDRVCVFSRSGGQFDALSAILKLDDVELAPFGSSYSRDLDFDYQVEKNWLTNLIEIGIDEAGFNDNTKMIWAHCVCDAVERASADDRHLDQTGSRMMFEILESFSEDKRQAACASFISGLSTQEGSHYVVHSFFQWCSFDHYFGMSASEAVLAVHDGSLKLDWKKEFILELIDNILTDRGSYVSSKKYKPAYQAISLAADYKDGGSLINGDFLAYASKTLEHAFENYQITSDLYEAKLTDSTYPDEHRVVSDVVAAYKLCLKYVFTDGGSKMTPSDYERKVKSFNDDRSKAVLSKSFFALGSVIGCNEDIMNHFNLLVEKYGAKPEFLYEISGIDKSVMCKDINFAAAIFSSELGL